jgi:uncharacterized membrane protein
MNKSKKGIIILNTILIILVICLSAFIIVDKFVLNNNEDKKDESTTSEVTTKDTSSSKEETDKDEYGNEVTGSPELDSITTVYENAYNYINENEINDLTNFNKYSSNLKTYFTDKALNYISLNENNNNDVFFSGLFGRTDGGIRQLSIVSSSDDVIIANGQLQSSDTTDGDAYPLYIIFVKENDSYKIDMFE